jgi:chorismate mutase / prephenate dehydratase
MADDSEELGKLRGAIDRVDGELLRLLNQRAGYAQQIGKIKQGKVVYRPEREAQVLRRLIAENPGALADAAIHNIFREVMSACLALEQALCVAYLGPAGTYSESAATRHFGSSPTLTPCASIDEVFRAVESGNADYGVVPVENSSEGAIGRTLDLLLNSSIKICGEINLPVHHNLLAKQSLDGVTKLYSHAQSLAQCHEWLNRNLSGIERLPVASNAEAARLAAEDATACAVAGEAAAKRYGLNILNANIEDDPDNTTRFLVIAMHDAGISGKDKTSLICSAQNKPGAVHDLLAPLALHNVSMTRFESRPARGFGGSRWEYVFYMDIEGHRLDAAVAAALEELRRRAGFVKELGSYPCAVS